MVRSFHKLLLIPSKFGEANLKRVKIVSIFQDCGHRFSATENETRSHQVRKLFWKLSYEVNLTVAWKVMKHELGSGGIFPGTSRARC